MIVDLSSPRHFKMAWKVFLSQFQAKKITDSMKVFLNFSHNSSLPSWQVSRWAVFWHAALGTVWLLFAEFQEGSLCQRAWNNRARFSQPVAARCRPSPARARGKLQTCHLLLLLLLHLLLFPLLPLPLPLCDDSEKCAWLSSCCQKRKLRSDENSEIDRRFLYKNLAPFKP